MSPRRIFAALAVLALAAITVTAGAAFANELPGFSGGPQDSGLRDGWHGKDATHTDTGTNGGTGVDGSYGGWDENDHDAGAGEVDGAGANGGDGSWGGVDQNGGSGTVDGAGAGSGSGSGQNSGSGGVASGGDVTGSGAGTPSAPVEAPAVAPSGPAPDGATAAPTSGPVTDAFVAAGDNTDAPGAVVPAPDAASVTEPALQQSELAGLAELPVLGSIGQVANQVTDGPSAARALLSTGTGRSLAVLLSLLVAISVFLAVHRRADRGDRKLATARTGPEVARFR